MNKQVTKYKFILVLLIINLLCSCSSFKMTPYFQNMKSGSSEKITNVSPLIIQPQDLLGIYVTSVNPKASDIFNTSLNRVNGNDFDVNPTNPVIGHLVGISGDIQLPLIGALKVDGLTTKQLQLLITNKISQEVKDPVVTVRILNFRVSVLGDVGRPGVYPVTNERISIIDAIGLAGDLNITAVRKDVKLIREVDGERKYFLIDLTNKEVFDSPYFYLKNNDVIYVQAGKERYEQVSRKYEKLSLVLSALSIVAIVFTTLHK